MTHLNLLANPGANFELQVNVQVQLNGSLENCTAADAKLVMPKGAIRPVTVPVTITGGTPQNGSLTLSRGSIEGASLKIDCNEGEDFSVAAGDISLGCCDNYYGANVVFGSVQIEPSVSVRVKVFLEGALE